MNINKKLYQELTPKQRAIACYSAVNRNDQTEIDRLMGAASRDHELYKAIRGLGRCFEAYNLLMNRATIGLLLEARYQEKAVSFCKGWIAAGGAENNAGYQRCLLAAESLDSSSDNWIGEINEVQLAAREWCEKNQIPVDFFSGPLCSFPLPDEMEEAKDSETLDAVRSVFDQITLGL